MSTLSEYLNAHLPDDWTKARLVDELDGVIDRATVYRYLSGRHPRTPADPILRAFASVLPGATVYELRHAAAAPEPTGDPWIPPTEANRLNSGQRAALSDFIRATVNWQDHIDSSEQDEPVHAIEVPVESRGDLDDYVRKLHSSGMSGLADRVAATLAADPDPANTGQPSRK